MAALKGRCSKADGGYKILLREQQGKPETNGNNRKSLYMFSPQLPEPVLFHPLKHHLGYLREFTRQGATYSEAELKAALRTLGNSQMDLYTGLLSPLRVAQEVVTHLQEQNLLQPETYRTYLNTISKEYFTLTLSDETDWVLRWGRVDGRHVHLHPARYTGHTTRVKANVLKTAAASVIASRKWGEITIDTPLVNRVRVEWLALPPVKTFSAEEGAGEIIRLLKDA
jgi:hypothetical protein